MFALNPKLKADTVEVCRLELSRVLLMNDRSLPWLVLVPERQDIREICELQANDRVTLIEEIAIASQVIQRLYSPDKINIGALGNIVPQLHVHVVGRFKTDRAWPGPIWGAGNAEPYTENECNAVCSRLKDAFIGQ